MLGEKGLPTDGHDHDDAERGSGESLTLRELRLTSLQPLDSFLLSGVRKLDLSRNSLRSLAGIEFLQLLESLSIYYNDISDVLEVTRLGSALKRLTALDTRLNPCSSPRNRHLLAAAFPCLALLDRAPVVSSSASDLPLSDERLVSARSTQLPHPLAVACTVDGLLVHADGRRERVSIAAHVVGSAADSPQRPDARIEGPGEGCARPRPLSLPVAAVGHVAAVAAPSLASAPAAALPSPCGGGCLSRDAELQTPTLRWPIAKRSFLSVAGVGVAVPGSAAVSSEDAAVRLASGLAPASAAPEPQAGALGDGDSPAVDPAAAQEVSSPGALESSAWWWALSPSSVKGGSAVVRLAVDGASGSAAARGSSPLAAMSWRTSPADCTASLESPSTPRASARASTASSLASTLTLASSALEPRSARDLGGAEGAALIARMAAAHPPAAEALASFVADPDASATAAPLRAWNLGCDAAAPPSISTRLPLSALNACAPASAPFASAGSSPPAALSRRALLFPALAAFPHLVPPPARACEEARPGLPGACNFASLRAGRAEQAPLQGAAPFAASVVAVSAAPLRPAAIRLQCDYLLARRVRMAALLALPRRQSTAPVSAEALSAAAAAACDRERQPASPERAISASYAAAAITEAASRLAATEAPAGPAPSAPCSPAGEARPASGRASGAASSTPLHPAALHASLRERQRLHTPPSRIDAASSSRPGAGVRLLSPTLPRPLPSPDSPPPVRLGSRSPALCASSPRWLPRGDAPEALSPRCRQRKAPTPRQADSLALRRLLRGAADAESLPDPATARLPLRHEVIRAGVERGSGSGADARVGEMCKSVRAMPRAVGEGTPAVAVAASPACCTSPPFAAVHAPEFWQSFATAQVETVAALTHAYALLQRSFESLRADGEALRRQLDGDVAREAALRAELEAARGEVSSQLGRISDLEAALVAAAVERAAAAERLAAQCSETAEAHARRQTAEAELELARGEHLAQLERWRGLFLDLRGQFEELEDEGAEPTPGRAHSPPGELQSEE